MIHSAHLHGLTFKKKNEEHTRFNPVLCLINSNYNLQRLFTFDLFTYNKKTNQPFSTL